jgi:glycine/D-amino acid oxidase-like deaminating enzyme
MPQDKTVLVIDKGQSQLNLTELHNVPGIPRGKPGKELLAELKEQALSFGGVEIKEDAVTSITGTKGNFTIKTAESEYHAKTLVLATGLVKYDIEGLGIHPIPNDRVPKPNLIRLEVPSNGQVVDGVYVAGLLAGEPTMYTVAAGSGVKVACAITSEWMGQLAVVHDVKGSRTN